MNFDAKYKSLMKDVEAKIVEFFERERQTNVNKTSIDSIKEFSLRGGKRLRPIAIIEGYKACGGKDVEEVTKASISLELLHSYFLMHDDVMDEDPIRRNMPTAHKKYEELFIKKYGAPRKLAKKEGENFAITDGDITSALARKAILRSDFPAKTKCAVLEELVDIELRTAYGQTLDESSKLKPVGVNSVLDIHLYKTAWYTLAGPLRIGAIFANATENQIASLTDYGINAGLAFQIKDDMMGVLSPKELCKAKNDVSEGKTTMPLAFLYACGNRKQIDIVNSYRGKPMTEEDTKKVISILTESNALENCEELANKYTTKAKKALSKANLLNKEFLYSLADFAAKRSR
jgi:geranylgeranyl diphosphate synthase type I